MFMFMCEHVPLAEVILVVHVVFRYIVAATSNIKKKMQKHRVILNENVSMPE